MSEFGAWVRKATYNVSGKVLIPAFCILTCFVASPNKYGICRKTKTRPLSVGIDYYLSYIVDKTQDTYKELWYHRANETSNVKTEKRGLNRGCKVRGTSSEHDWRSVAIGSNDRSNFDENINVSDRIRIIGLAEITLILRGR